MAEVEMLFDIDLDEAIDTEIYGVKLLGRAPCFYDYGKWHVDMYDTQKPASEMDCPSRPISADRCLCDMFPLYTTPAEMRFMGHTDVCLRATPSYSEDLIEALGVVKTIKPLSFSLHHIDDLWVAEMQDHGHLYRSRIPGDINALDRAATVVSKTALRYVRKEATEVFPRWQKPFRWLACLAVGHDDRGFGGHYGWTCRKCERNTR